MKRLLLVLSLSILMVSGFSQDFFREQFNPRKQYVILVNPTAGNLETVKFLIDRQLLDVRTRKVKFVGVYHRGQAYDFSQSRRFIEQNNLGRDFFLHEVRSNLQEADLFRENGCTPDLQTIFRNSIGVIFFGGPDIPPTVYGQENTHSEVTDPVRHWFETTFLFHLLGSSRNPGYRALLEQKPAYLVTGFCLGLQTMNVATGGTLCQDIPALVYGKKTAAETLEIGRANLHRNYWQEISNDPQLMRINLHTIRFTDHPFFVKKVKAWKNMEPRVLSSHHQSIDQLGAGLEVTALSPDGKVIEAVAHSRFPNVFAVQFHPEVPALYEPREALKFHPDDTPLSYVQIIGKTSQKFHQKYWKYLSAIIQTAKNRP